MRLSLWNRHLAWAACTAIGLALSAAGSAQAMLIDSFDTAFDGPGFLAAEASGESTAVVNHSSAIIGGQREMSLSLNGDDGLAVVLPGSSGLMQVQAGTDVRSTLGLTYDGIAGLDTFDATGLGGIALTGGSFFLRAMSTAPITATFRVFTDADNYSEGTLTTTATGLIETTFGLEFSDFDVAAGAGADFDNVGAIQIELEVTGSAFMSYVGFESEEDPDDDLPVVPEPGSWALLSLGAIGAIGFGWFQRRKPQVV